MTNTENKETVGYVPTPLEMVIVSLHDMREMINYMDNIAHRFARPFDTQEMVDDEGQKLYYFYQYLIAFNKHMENFSNALNEPDNNPLYVEAVDTNATDEKLESVVTD